MKLGILITCYNRPKELSECLSALAAAAIPKGTEILLVDDASTNADTIRLLYSCRFTGAKTTVHRNKANSRVCNSLRTGFRNLFAKGCTQVINLDSDAIVRKDFIAVLLALHKRFPDNIVTGFNSMNVTLEGKPRHPIVKSGKGWHMKSSVGGINMLLTKKLFTDLVEPQLNRVINGQGNWDYLTCIESMKQCKPIVVTVPSVVQHIAGISSMGHKEPPDVACDFHNLALNKVTLLGVDCVNIDRLMKAAEYSTRYIKFADVRLLTSKAVTAPNVYRIPHLHNIHEYSRFMIRELNDYFDTEYCLVIQHDGYVIDYKAWRDDFLKCDYIGATWWYKDGMNVGNGGFSLRSKKLQQLLQYDETIKLYHPEDEHICRTYRAHLESKGIKFATEDLANRFAIESAYSPDKIYSGQFGFHGKGIIFSE